MSYEDFLARKLITAPAVGLSDVPPLNPMMFPFQRDIVSWSLRRGRSAIWADCGSPVMRGSRDRRDYSFACSGCAAVFADVEMSPNVADEQRRGKDST